MLKKHLVFSEIIDIIKGITVENRKEHFATNRKGIFNNE